VIAVVCSLLAFYTLLGVLLVRRERRRPLERDRIVREARARHDVGPDALRLLDDLDAHLNEYAATVAGLYEPVGPDYSARCARLRAAIRDEQNGDPT
jgi:hypothetical protein